MSDYYDWNVFRHPLFVKQERKASSEIMKPSLKLANRLEGICRDRKKRSLLLLVN